MKPLSLKRINRDLENHEYNINENNIVNFHYNNYNIAFYLNEDYPFKPPVLYLNNKLLSYRYYYFPPKILKLYIESGRDCPCCYNLSCHNQWSPALSILNIVDEYRSIIIKMIDIYKKHIVSFIPNLPDDIIGIIKEFI